MQSALSIPKMTPDRFRTITTTFSIKKTKKLEVKWIFFEFFCQKFWKKIHFTSNFGWGALPPRLPVFWLGEQSPPRPPPLNVRSSHLIEAAKRGRLDQMIFFSAPLTTRAPPTTVRPDVRPDVRPNTRPNAWPNARPKKVYRLCV